MGGCRFRVEGRGFGDKDLLARNPSPTPGVANTNDPTCGTPPKMSPQNENPCSWGVAQRERERQRESDRESETRQRDSTAETGGTAEEEEMVVRDLAPAPGKRGGGTERERGREGE